MKIDTVSRFSSKAEKYAKCRPDYSAEAIRAIFEHAKLTTKSVVADIGSGTGIVSRHFVKNGNSVYAVEPNPEMRRKAEIALGKYPNYHSLDGNSEQTNLPNASIDLITVGQAIHWFDPEPSKPEFVRILKPQGWFAILHHTRSDDELNREIRRICTAENGWDITSTHSRPLQSRPFEWWFDKQNEMLHLKFSNPHTYDLKGLIGLELSNSHAPDESHHAFPAIADSLERVFEKFQDQGKITINFTTNLYLGRIDGGR